MQKHIAERAYELAAEGMDLDRIRFTLGREGYVSVDNHLKGSLRRELYKILRDQGIDPYNRQKTI
jgi:hypothetical protein